MMEVIFSSSELRESTISGSNNKKRLDSLRVAAIKGINQHIIVILLKFNEILANKKTCKFYLVKSV